MHFVEKQYIFNLRVFAFEFADTLFGEKNPVAIEFDYKKTAGDSSANVRLVGRNVTFVSGHKDSLVVVLLMALQRPHILLVLSQPGQSLDPGVAVSLLLAKRINMDIRYRNVLAER